MHEQLVWPTSVLLVLYSCDVGQTRQLVSPRSEKRPAVQLLHTMLAEGLHVEVPSQTEPAAHAAVPVQAAQGARPVELQFVPLMHGSAQVFVAMFHA